MILGIAALIIGFRIYKFLISLPGAILVGVIGGGIGYGMGREIGALIGGLLGLAIGGSLAWALHQLAIFFAGGFIGWSICSSVSLAVFHTAPNQVVAIIIAIITGSILLGLSQAFIMVTSSFLGAIFIMLGTNNMGNMTMLVGLTILGSVIQLGVMKIFGIKPEGTAEEKKQESRPRPVAAQRTSVEAPKYLQSQTNAPRCPHCNKEILDQNNNFCTGCGKEMSSKFCTQCGIIIEDQANAAFCTGCGSAI